MLPPLPVLDAESPKLPMQPLEVGQLGLEGPLRLP